MSRVLRTFREMLGLLSRGDFSRHLDAQLNEAIAAVEACPADKCKAEITVKITLDYELGRIDVKAESKSKLPDTVKFMKTPFWAIDGQLSVEHPEPDRHVPGAQRRQGRRRRRRPGGHRLIPFPPDVSNPERGKSTMSDPKQPLDAHAIELITTLAAEAASSLDVPPSPPADSATACRPACRWPSTARPDVQVDQAFDRRVPPGARAPQGHGDGRNAGQLHCIGRPSQGRKLGTVRQDRDGRIRS
jgi:hypothetical protein